jgi:polysaccharide chain length determinant protein (PEP-CTERM system associated)
VRPEAARGHRLQELYILPELEQEGDIGELVARLLGIVVRRRWWIAGTACTVILGTIAVLFQLPNRYTSEATLLVVQQQVPQRYVVPNSSTDLTSALQAIKQEVLSRPRLLEMIDNFGLYPKERRRLAQEDLIALMLKNIDIVPLGERTQQKDYDAFKIFFTTENALLAQQVTSTLTSLFINENLRTREEQATNTTKFLREQLEAKRKRLEEQEQRLRDFKMQHIGELPEQQQGNLGILSGLQTQLQNTMSALNRGQQQRAYLQSLLDAYARQRTHNGVAVSLPGTPNTSQTRALTPIEIAQNELARLESEKAALLAKSYTAQHPDMRKIQREITRVEDTVRRLKAANPVTKDEASPVTAQSSPSRAAPSDAGEDTATAQIRSQLEANRLEIENLLRDEKQLKSTIAQYESRLNRTPYAEQQQASIIRDTEALRAEYADLQKKEQESQLATNLEKQQGGQQFRLIDPASLPTLPSSPKRLKMSGMATALGIILGLGVGVLLELRTPSFHTEKELVKHLGAPLVVGLPLLFTASEIRRRKWVTRFEWIAGSILVLAVSMAEFYVYKRG